MVAVVAAAWRAGECGTSAAAAVGSSLAQRDALGIEPTTESGSPGRVALAPPRTSAGVGAATESRDGKRRIGARKGPEAIELAAIEGVVYWSNGLPAASARVHVAQRGATGERQIYGGTTETDAEGRFHLPVLREGICTVSAAANAPKGESGAARPVRTGGPRCTAVAEYVAPGARALRLVLQPGELLSGRVVDDAGEPVAAFTLRARPRDGALPHPLDDQLLRRFRNEEGRFELDDLLAGEWEIEAHSFHHANSNLRRVRVPSGGELVLRMERRARIAGRVSLPDGRAAANVRVEVEHGRGKPSTGVRTDEGGRFDGLELPPGDYRLVAKAKGFATSVEQRISLAPAEERNDLALVLRRGARIAVEVRPAREDPRLSISLGGPGGRRTASIGAEGPAEFRDLEPGEYVVSLDTPSRHESVLETGTVVISMRKAIASERFILAEGEARSVVLEPTEAVDEP